MRILKGYSKDEQKELEDAKKKYMNGSNLLQIIAGVPLDAGCGFIWIKYDKAEPDEQISLIKDILDFYTDKAKFAEQKYYIKMPEDKNMIEKIEVPNIFDEWYKGFPSADVRNKLAISEIAREGCGHSIILHTESRAYFEKSELNRLADFFNNNSKILIEMLNKYASEAYYVKPIKKYYIKMPKVNYPYLIRDMGGKFDYAQSPDVLSSGENSFTEQEIKDIDPRYMAFAIPVEEDDE